MSETAWSILINVVSSALVGAAVWLGQRALWRRRLGRERRFYGLQPGEDCLLVVNRHHSGTERSVHRADVSALLQLAGLLQECGARPQVIFHDQATEGLGLRTEYCIGGPGSNARTAAHLRHGLPGVTIGPYDQGAAIQVASGAYPCEHDVAEYAVLARIAGPAQERPVFVICGQTAIANQGAVGYLVSHRDELARTHGLEGRFCLVLRVVEPPVYGPNLVELVGDVTAEAFAAPAAPALPAAAAPPAATAPD